MQTPALLIQSGLTQGPVGHGFQAHPGVSMAGRFPDPVRVWEGATQGHEIIGLRREGIKIEVLSYDLTLIAGRIPGSGGPLAAQMADIDRWALWGAAIRSTARGRVRVLFGKTLVTWSPTVEDLGRYRRAIAIMGELMLAAGAESVAPGVRGVAPTMTDAAALRAFQAEGPRSASAYRAVITHMFGTCKMGADSARSVVRPDFRHHATAGLYVADSSVFPTNLGVNPQVPIAAVAALAARSVLAS